MIVSRMDACRFQPLTQNRCMLRLLSTWFSTENKTVLVFKYDWNRCLITIQQWALYLYRRYGLVIPRSLHTLSQALMLLKSEMKARDFHTMETSYLEIALTTLSQILGWT